MRFDKLQITIPSSYVHIDSFGRIYFDQCATDTEHMFAPVTPGSDRRRCRFYLEDLVTKEARGKKGTWKVTLELITDESKET